jgi:glycosyltransferase involved in cell wall biosynthesis
MAKTVILSVSNDIVTDQRVLKMAGEISSLDANVTIVGRRLPWSLEIEDLTFNIVRFRMWFKKGFLFYKFLNIRIFFYLLFHRANLLVANDLDTLLPNFLVSRLKKIPLVYDAHEYFTGSPELQNRRLVRGIWKQIERLTLPRIKHMITVNGSIAALYQAEYGVNPVVVHNFSRRWLGEPASREELGISQGELLCVIQGTGINRDRGGRELIEAVSTLDNVHLLIIGRGDEYSALKDKVYKTGMLDRVTFLPVMEWSDMMSHTAMADVGLSLDSSVSLNYQNSLPNKIFDYMQAGLAIVSTDMKEITPIINQRGCGIIIERASEEIISGAISSLRDDPGKLKKYKEGSIISSNEYCWDSEAETVKKFYSGLEF